MNEELRKDLSYKKSIALLAIVSILSGLATVIIGELFLPIAAASFAALLLYERDSRKIISIASGVLTLICNVIFGILHGNYLPLLAVEIILLGLIIFYMYSKNMGKGECAFIVTVVTTLMLVVSFVYLAMYTMGEYTWDAVVNYYTKFYEALKNETVMQLTSITSNLSGNTVEMVITADEAVKMFDSMLNLLIAFVIIAGFFIAGVTFKIFSAIVLRCSNNFEKIAMWRFGTSNIIAYFYIILFVLSIFITSDTDVFSITVTNLYYVFMFVFAYIGLNYAHAMLATRKSPVFVWLLLIFAMLVMSSFAISVLSALGVFFTITKNKFEGHQGSSGESNS